MTTQATPAESGPSTEAILAALKVIAEWWRKREQVEEKVEEAA